MKQSAKPSWSLVRRLLLSFTGSFIVLALISNASLYYFLNRGLESERSSILQDRMDAIATLLKSPAHGLEELQRRIQTEWPVRGGEAIYVEIFDHHQKLIAISPHIPDLLQQQLAQITAIAPEHLEGADGKIYLGRSQLYENSVGLDGPLLVKVFIGQEQGREFLARFQGLMLFTLLISILISFLLGFIITVRGMSPLRATALAIGKIDSKNLHERLDLKNLPVELQTLTQAFNQTLDRLEDSFKKLDRFSSDIAHELRTPVASMMGEIELALTRPRAEEEYKEILLSLFEECSRIHAITSSLLFLARSENKNDMLQAELISVSSEIMALVDFFEPQASEKGIHLGLDPGTLEMLKKENIFVQAQVTLFQRMIANLLANAIQYTPQNGHVVIGFHSQADAVEIWIKDDGPGISTEDLPRIFDRFYRVDPSRNPHSGGLGLGLAIVKNIVELYHGQIQVQSQLGQGTQFVITWPIGNEISPDSSKPKV